MTLVSLSTPPLNRYSGRGVTIAVIDSGVHAGHPHIGSIAGGTAFGTEGVEGTDTVDRLGHGTAVTAAIQEKAPDAEIHIVKVFDDALATSVPTLVRAIDWASERAIRLVNLSLGTPHAHRAEQLGPALERAKERGTIVVSALEDGGTSWLPGSLAGAAGVLLDRECPRDAVRLVECPAGPGSRDGRSGRRHAIAASPFPRPIPGVPVERNLSGVSFAVANATGILARAIEHRPDVSDPQSLVSLIAELVG